MRRLPHIRLRRFLRKSEGAILVEFSMVVPLLLVFFAVAVEGSRLAWTYQMAAHGVRDAARMVARMAPDDLCPAGRVGRFRELTEYSTEVEDAVKYSIDNKSVVPFGADVTNVTPWLYCVTGSYKLPTTSIVEVRAEVRFNYLFGGILGMFSERLETLEAEIADQSKVYGT